ncbi:hypothetical protein M413DRAFT_31167 [Hebeloma cylindrosporum]|uniref:Nephrocystin 3-like N-terminal domain-containing protein n=1 Tax=Hebeloma cylindrosporum TaxID=76867 RepID=A0A0C2Y7I6_HEBCY|nr:hypothetical protein M413DRAFT_31167 [Hebeloma cylindrosporum h7]
MNEEGSNSTTIATPLSLLTNATNTSITGGNIVAVSMGDVAVLQQPMPTQRGLDLLYNNIALGALHNSAERYDPPKCLPQTREEILSDIMGWVKMHPNNKEFFLWLYGGAGAGKSAIAQTIAEMCQQAGLVAAAFFFSRTAAGRNDISRLVSTLVYQLIKTIPEIRERVLTLLGDDPHILSQAPSAQMRTLVVEPLNTVPSEILTQRPRFIIIDGLDECGNASSQCQILNILASSVPNLNTPLRFLIASRLEPDIRLTFSSNVLNSMTRSIPLGHSFETAQDIRHFLRTKFQEIRSTHPMGLHIPPSWPSEANIEAIAIKSTAHFIYAATVIRYVESPSHRPEDRLETILGLRSDQYEPFAGLDSLYMQILSAIDKRWLDKVLDILRCLVFIWGEDHDIVKASAESLEDFLCYRRGDVNILMSDLHALVYLPPPDKLYMPIEIYHASFSDFLVDRRRSQEFFLDPETTHASLACRWIPYMEKTRGPKKWSQSKMAFWLDVEFHHISRAACTPQLVVVLTHFNFFHILKGNDRYECSLRYIPGFMRWLHGKRASGALSPEAFNRQFEHFDEYVLHELAALPLEFQKCIAAAMSLTPFYGEGNNSSRMAFIIWSAYCKLSRLFYRHLKTPEYDHSFPYILEYLRKFFRDPKRSGPFTVTSVSYKDLALRCARVIFDSTWIPVPGYDDPRGIDLIDEFKVVAMECLSLTLPKAAKSYALASFLREHALQVCVTERLYQERCEVAIPCLRYIKRCGLALRNHKHHEDYSCIICEDTTYQYSSQTLEGIQAWVEYLFGFV